MSTFGKKSLIWWDYHTHDVVRYNHTDPILQLRILEKWYPIGMEFNIWSAYSKRLEKPLHIITGYKYHELLQTHRISSDLYFGKSAEPKHPMLVIPTDDWILKIKREYKIERLLK
jgi:hypothetical protein